MCNLGISRARAFEEEISVHAVLVWPSAGLPMLSVDKINPATCIVLMSGDSMQYGFRFRGWVRVS